MGCGSSACGGSGAPYDATAFSSVLDSYSLHNLTLKPIEFAIYHVPITGDKAIVRATPVIYLNPAETKLIAHPDLKFGYFRKGVARDPERDPETLLARVVTAQRWKAEYENDDPCYVMNLEASHSLLIHESRKTISKPLLLHLTSPVGYAAYKATAPVVEGWEELKAKVKTEVLDTLDDELGQYKYDGRQAFARYSKDIPENEKEFVEHRLMKVRDSLGKFLDMDLKELPLDQIPKISLACSGGGYRAMLASLGVLMEMEKAGLWDCVLYTAGLSGGAWLLTNVYGSPCKTMLELKDNLKEKLGKDFYTMELFPHTVVQEVRERIAQQCTLNTIDDYCWHISHHLQRDYPRSKDLWNRPRLSEQTAKVQLGNAPLPIYTAVQSIPDGPYRWMEFTPYEVGFRDDVNAFIPTWSFGRNWADGASINHNAEPTLGYMCGLFGSAFCATVDQICCETIANDKFRHFIQAIMHEVAPDVGTSRFFTPAIVPNFAHEGPLRNLDHLRVMDAGCAFNIPFTPLIRPERQVDVIIALDQSGGRDQVFSTNLQLAAEYAKKMEFPFPDISEATKVENMHQTPESKQKSEGSKQPLTVCMGNTEKGVPTVMYMSLIKNDEFNTDFDPRTAKFCATSNWTYEGNQVDLLTGLTAHNTRQSMEQIKRVLKIILRDKMSGEGKPLANKAKSTPTYGRVRSNVDELEGDESPPFAPSNAPANNRAKSTPAASAKVAPLISEDSTTESPLLSTISNQAPVSPKSPASVMTPTNVGLTIDSKGNKDSSNVLFQPSSRVKTSTAAKYAPSSFADAAEAHGQDE